MQWNLEQLRSFVNAAESGSFSAAARRQGKAQSVVSTHIAQLEIDFGVELFDRSGRTPTLTEAGSVLLEEAREVLRQCARLDERARTFGSGLEAELLLAVDEAVPYYELMQAVADLGRRFPQIRVSLLYGSTSEVHDWVERGEARLGVALEASRALPRDMESRRLGRVQQALAVSADHPLHAEKNITRTALARHRQIVIRVTSVRNDEILSPLYWETNSSYLAMDLAARGVGWTVIPLTLAQAQGIPQGLKVLDPGAVSLPALDILLVWKSGRIPAGAGAWLADRLELALSRN